MQIPFVDLKPQYQSIKHEIDQAIEQVMSTTSFIGGPTVKQFETEFAQYIGTKHSIGVANGTDAIEIALTALGIGPEDEVIIPAMSWISTAEAVSYVGAKPVFVDVDSQMHTLDAALIESKITSRTKAIIPVHLYGCPADIEAILVLAKKYNLKVIEDTAQAHGAEVYGQVVGTFGDISTFSFYPGKNLGAYGDAGAICTNDDQLAQKCRMISNHGQKAKHDHEMEGRNSRLDTLQAAILSVKLKHIDKWTEQRIANAKYYHELLSKSGVQIPVTSQGIKHVFHVYSVLIEDRDAVKLEMLKRGIATQIHYPHSLPELKPYKSTENLDEYPNAVRLGQKVLSLPMYPELTKEQIAFVVQNLIKMTG